MWVFLDDAEETFDIDTYAILSRGVGLGSDPHACVAAPSDNFENADVLDSIEPGSDGDEDDDSFGQQLALLSGRLSQSPDEMENKQKTADDLKAKVDTPTPASPKRPFVVDMEQEKHTPTTTSKTQKNWMEALAEKNVDKVMKRSNTKLAEFPGAGWSTRSQHLKGHRNSKGCVTC